MMICIPEIVQQPQMEHTVKANSNVFTNMLVVIHTRCLFYFINLKQISIYSIRFMLYQYTKINNKSILWPLVESVC